MHAYQASNAKLRQRGHMTEQPTMGRTHPKRTTLPKSLLYTLKVLQTHLQLLPTYFPLLLSPCL